MAARFPVGPLAVLDVAPSGKALVTFLADGELAPSGRTLADAVEWALEGLSSQPDFPCTAPVVRRRRGARQSGVVR